MNYVRPLSMYRSGKEMKARNNMRKCVQRTQPQILRIIQKKNPKYGKCTNDEHKIPGKKFQRIIPQKKFLSKDGKKKSQNSRNQKCRIIRSVDQKSNHYMCAAVRTKQRLSKLKKKYCYLRSKPLQ